MTDYTVSGDQTIVDDVSTINVIGSTANVTVVGYSDTINASANDDTITQLGGPDVLNLSGRGISASVDYDAVITVSGDKAAITCAGYGAATFTGNGTASDHMTESMFGNNGSYDFITVSGSYIDLSIMGTNLVTLSGSNDSVSTAGSTSNHTSIYAQNGGSFYEMSSNYSDVSIVGNGVLAYINHGLGEIVTIQGTGNTVYFNNSEVGYGNLIYLYGNNNIIHDNVAGNLGISGGSNTTIYLNHDNIITTITCPDPTVVSSGNNDDISINFAATANVTLSGGGNVIRLYETNASITISKNAAVDGPDTFIFNSNSDGAVTIAGFTPTGANHDYIELDSSLLYDKNGHAISPDKWMNENLSSVGNDAVIHDGLNTITVVGHSLNPGHDIIFV
jgi:hypothetical protein